MPSKVLEQQTAPQRHMAMCQAGSQHQCITEVFKLVIHTCATKNSDSLPLAIIAHAQTTNLKNSVQQLFNLAILEFACMGFKLAMQGA